MSRISALCGGLLSVLLAAIVLANESDVFRRVDSNEDGFVTADEVNDGQRRLFDRLLRTSDKDGDGKLSRDEFVAGTTASPDTADVPQQGSPFGFGGGRQPNFQPGQLLRRLDRDGDGKLSREEAPQRMRQGFDRLDANTDGYIDADEFRRLTRAFRDAAPQTPPDASQFSQTAARIFRERDANADGRVTLDELPKERREPFKRLASMFDLDTDGGLTLEQFSRVLRATQQ
jgi:Ca2+-binding EF-hand superfamily protein